MLKTDKLTMEGVKNKALDDQAEQVQNQHSTIKKDCEQ